MGYYIKRRIVTGNGTWTRMDASNREMSAAEIADLAYQRGVKSAETLPMPVALDLLNTGAWRSYCVTRGLADMDLAVRLPRLGLAIPVDGALQPLLAALLLFADEPGALLAGQAMRADIRVSHFQGKTIQRGEVPNLLLPPKTMTGLAVEQIAQAQAYVLDRLAIGLTMPGSGFKTRYRFPERVTTANRLTRQLADARNVQAAQLAEKIVVAHASSGGSLAKLLCQWRMDGCQIDLLSDGSRLRQRNG